MRPVTLASPYTLTEFNAMLATRQLAPAECMTLRLVNGPFAGINLFYTSSQADVTAPAVDQSVAIQRYVARDVGVKGLRFKITSGQNQTPGDPTVNITIDEQSLILTPNQNPAVPSTINGIPFVDAVLLGALDGATIQRDRWFLNGPGGAPVGGIPMFYGYASSLVKASATAVELKVKSTLVLLNEMMPRNVYQPNCIYTVYDDGCGVSLSANQVSGAVGASPTKTFLPWTSATTQFTGGSVFFESGLNTNVTATIKSADTSGLTLSYPLPYLPLAGDLFLAAPGCDRQYAGGCAYFNNQDRFRGTPNVPPPEFAI